MFSLQKYKTLIFNLTNAGLAPSIEWDKHTSRNTLFLRHDVDFSVDFAHTLAKLEFQLGIQSTYFFMLTSNMYNLMSPENKKLVNNIKEMGHKLSIHFDPTAYDALEYFKNEKMLFERVFDVEVDIASIHRSGQFLQNNNVSLCGVPQTYNDIYFTKMKYISDSGGRNVEPQINNYLKGSREQGLQLLIHPLWWVGEGTDATETLNFWHQKNAEFIKSEIRLNCKTYED